MAWTIVDHDRRSLVVFRQEIAFGNEYPCHLVSTRVTPQRYAQETRSASGLPPPTRWANAIWLVYICLFRLALIARRALHSGQAFYISSCCVTMLAHGTVGGQWPTVIVPFLAWVLLPTCPVDILVSKTQVVERQHRFGAEVFPSCMFDAYPDCSHNVSTSNASIVVDGVSVFTSRVLSSFWAAHVRPNMDVQIASILPVGHDATFGEHVVALEALYFDPYWFANGVGEWYGCSNAAERPLVRFTTEFVMATDVLDTGGYVACIFDMTPDTDGHVACNLTLHTFMESEQSGQPFFLGTPYVSVGWQTLCYCFVLTVVYLDWCNRFPILLVVKSANWVALGKAPVLGNVKTLGAWHRAGFWLLLFLLLKPAAGVNCQSCFDGIDGCAGGANCLFATRTAANLAALTVAGGAAINVVSLLPTAYI